MINFWRWVFVFFCPEQAFLLMMIHTMMLDICLFVHIYLCLCFFYYFRQYNSTVTAAEESMHLYPRRYRVRFKPAWCVTILIWLLEWVPTTMKTSLWWLRLQEENSSLTSSFLPPKDSRITLLWTYGDRNNFFKCLFQMLPKVYSCVLGVYLITTADINRINILHF